MDEIMPAVPAWAGRFRDREEFGLAMVVLYDPWPIESPPSPELGRWIGAMVGPCTLGTALHLIGLIVGRSGPVGIYGPDPRVDESQEGMIVMARGGSGVSSVIRFRYLSTGDPPH